jgi:hypothetical protein
MTASTRRSHTPKICGERTCNALDRGFNGTSFFDARPLGRNHGRVLSLTLTPSYPR